MNRLHFFLFEEAGGAGGGSGGGAGGGAGGGGLTGAGSGAEGAGGAGQGGGQSTSTWDVRQHVDDAGNFKPGWAKAAGIPESYESKYTSPHAAIRAMEQAQKLVGANKVALPGPNATPEERSAFYKAIGRPDKPEEYGLKMPEKLGDKPFPKEAWSDERAGAFSKLALEIGLTKEQANRLSEFGLTNAVADMASVQQARAAEKNAYIEKGTAALKSEWGAEFDANLALAEKGAAAAGLKKEDFANDPALANNPAFIKAMVAVAKMTGEQPGKGTRQSAGEPGVSRQQAAERARALTKEIADKTRADRQWATSAEAARLKAEKSRMFQIANPA